MYDIQIIKCSKPLIYKNVNNIKYMYQFNIVTKTINQIVKTKLLQFGKNVSVRTYYSISKIRLRVMETENV